MSPSPHDAAYRHEDLSGRARCTRCARLFESRSLAFTETGDLLCASCAPHPSVAGPMLPMRQPSLRLRPLVETTAACSMAIIVAYTATALDVPNPMLVALIAAGFGVFWIRRANLYVRWVQSDRL